MATVTYFVKGKKNPSPIYVRFSASREIFYRQSTEIFINPEYFNKGKVRNIAEFEKKDETKTKLNDLESQILKEHSLAQKNKYVFDKNWLKREIDKFHDRTLDIDLQYLDAYARFFIEKLPDRLGSKGNIIGVTDSTFKKYRTIEKKIIGFQQYQKQKYRLSEIDETFQVNLIKYLRDVEQLGENTIGRYIKFIKTIILDAEKYGHRISNYAKNIKGFVEEIDKIYLSFNDLDKIEQVKLESQELENARDWLIIGCYIGQRIGDTLALKAKNVHNVGELDFIELIQDKGKKKVMVLIHPKVRDILNKRGGNFPASFARSKGSKVTMFNRYIKTIAKKAGLTELIEGAKVNSSTNRKVKGIYPKWELITSHICRRSFATNYYGHVPTPFLMEITGHSREKEFLNYIGKKPIDYAEQMLKYWKVAIEEQEKKSHLKAV